MKKSVQPHTGAKRLFIIVYLVCACASGFGGSHAAYGSERIVSVDIHHVIDGDSLVVIDQGKYLEIRLWGIDAPEYDQPGSRSAKERLKELTRYGQGIIAIKDTDRYGRTVAILECNGINVNEALVASGAAWVHVYYCRDFPCKKWKILESDARKNHLGLWQWENPVAPWTWKSKRQ